MIGLLECAALAFFFAVALSLFTCGYILTDRRRIVGRGAWAVIALLLPVVGPMLYFVLGRAQPPPAGAKPPPFPTPFLQ